MSDEAWFMVCVTILIILLAGDPDLLGAIIQLIGADVAE